MQVNSMQFRPVVGLFNNQKVLKCNMNQPYFSNITIRQCQITPFRTCSPLVLLHLVLFLRYNSPPRQFRIQTLKLAFAMHLSRYSRINIWFIIVKSI